MKKIKTLGFVIVFGMIIIMTGCSAGAYSTLTITNGTYKKIIDIHVNGKKVVSGMKPGETQTVSVAYYPYSYTSRYLNVIAKATENGKFAGIAEKRIYLRRNLYYNYYNMNESVVFYEYNFRR